MMKQKAALNKSKKKKDFLRISLVFKKKILLRRRSITSNGLRECWEQTPNQKVSGKNNKKKKKKDFCGPRRDRRMKKKEIYLKICEDGGRERRKEISMMLKLCVVVSDSGKYFVNMLGAVRELGLGLIKF